MTGDIHELFEQEFGRMVSLARMMGAPNPEDVAQEAFLKVHTHWNSIRDPAAAPAYLRRTVMNLARNAVRYEVVRGRRRTFDATAVASAESVAIGRQDVAEVLTAIAELPYRQREALVLRHWSGLPYEAVADALGTSAANARSLVRRARIQVLRAAQITSLPQEWKRP